MIRGEESSGEMEVTLPNLPTPIVCYVPTNGGAGKHIRIVVGFASLPGGFVSSVSISGSSYEVCNCKAICPC